VGAVIAAHAGEPVGEIPAVHELDHLRNDRAQGKWGQVILMMPLNRFKGRKRKVGRESLAAFEEEPHLLSPSKEKEDAP